MINHYSEAHVQRLLNSLNNPTQEEVAVYQRLREALNSGAFHEYRLIAEETQTCLCELCHSVTRHTGTKRCDACWELETRFCEFQLQMWSATARGLATLVEFRDRIEHRLFTRRGPGTPA